MVNNSVVFSYSLKQNKKTIVNVLNHITQALFSPHTLTDVHTVEGGSGEWLTLSGSLLEDIVDLLTHHLT